MLVGFLRAVVPALKVFPATLVAVPLRLAATLLVVTHAGVTEPNDLCLAVLHCLHDELLAATRVSHWAVCLEVSYLVAGLIFHRVPHTQ